MEQHFSKVDRCHLERGSSANDTFCRSVIALADNGNEASDKQLLERAREIFAEGRRRLSYKKGLKRRDAGVQRATTSDPKNKGAKTEAEWLRKRRRDLDEALIETPPPKRAATADDFTPEMKKEAKHLQGVIERRRMEAQANGTLLEFEKARPLPRDENLLEDEGEEEELIPDVVPGYVPGRNPELGYDPEHGFSGPSSEGDYEPFLPGEPGGGIDADGDTLMEEDIEAVMTHVGPMMEFHFGRQLRLMLMDGTVTGRAERFGLHPNMGNGSTDLAVERCMA